MSSFFCKSYSCSHNLLFAKGWLISSLTHKNLLTVFSSLLSSTKFPSITVYIPSTMDLGKSRYGGPFVTESVHLLNELVVVLFCVYSICIQCHQCYNNSNYTCPLSSCNNYMHIYIILLCIAKPFFTDISH